MIEYLLLTLLYGVGAGISLGLALSNVADGHKNDLLKVFVGTLFWPVLFTYVFIRASTADD